MASEGSVTFSGWLRRVGYWFTWWPWRCLAVRWWQRRTRGFDDSEMWNLDLTLAEWLAPRLEALADMTDSSPAGYPRDRDDPGYDFDTSDFERWRDDTRKAAAALREVVECEMWNSPWWMAKGRTLDERVARETAARQPANEAMLWIAKWWRALWD